METTPTSVRYRHRRAIAVRHLPRHYKSLGLGNLEVDGIGNGLWSLETRVNRVADGRAAASAPWPWLNGVRLYHHKISYPTPRVGTFLRTD